MPLSPSAAPSTSLCKLLVLALPSRYTLGHLVGGACGQGTVGISFPIWRAKILVQKCQSFLNVPGGVRHPGLQMGVSGRGLCSADRLLLARPGLGSVQGPWLPTALL